MPVLLGAVADDFTGATDLASILVRAGMRTTLVLGVPAPDAVAPDVDAVVVALKSRNAPVEEAVADSVASWRWLKAVGAIQCFYKYCSTFDSTPGGNIGPVAKGLAEEIGSTRVIYCPAMPENGRTVYQGHLFVDDHLLSESSMRNHPLTPMRESDLRRVLAPQLGGDEVGLIPLEVVRRGETGMSTALAGAFHKHFIVDALTDDDLKTIGLAVSGESLVTGGSGLGVGLAAGFRRDGRLRRTAADALPQVGGAALCLSGSCSSATLAQVQAWKAAGKPVLEMGAVTFSELGVGPAIAWIKDKLSKQQSCLVAASQPPEKVARAQELLGRDKAAEIVESSLAEIAAAAAGQGVRRFVVAGGETSGAVTQALGVARLSVGRAIAPGVPWCASVDGEPVALALKSGNFGEDSFFDDAVMLAP